MSNTGNEARAKLILPHKDASLVKRVVRGKDSAVLMASQIEDDVAPKAPKVSSSSKTEWSQESAAAGRKLDLVPSYDEIIEAFSSASQPHTTRRSRRHSPYSSPIISQSQPVRRQKTRSHYCNTQKASIDLDDFEKLVAAKSLCVESPTKQSPPETISSATR